ncbi:MAG: ChaN family lipoprotein [Amaricoccus sp.]
MRVPSCAALVFAGLARAAVADPAGLDAFIDQARGADVVVLGEVHDNPAHHANQAAIVAALAPAALVFEMIPQAKEEAVNDMRAHGAPLSDIAVELNWRESGWPDFQFYSAILAAAPHAQIFGAGQPATDVARAMEEGAAAAFGPDAAIYGLDKPLRHGEQVQREAVLRDAHCEPPAPEMLPRMVEAQRFRDAGLADAAMWARTMTGGGQVVVIAGSGHADRHLGMPALIGLADPDLRVVSLGQFEAAPDDPGAYDAVLLAAAPSRPDPCAGQEAEPDPPASGSE